jgi:hypothetical protein
VGAAALDCASATVTWPERRAVAPTLSVTVRVTVYVPATAYAWAEFCVEAALPSPKSQWKATIEPSLSRLRSVKLHVRLVHAVREVGGGGSVRGAYVVTAARRAKPNSPDKRGDTEYWSHGHPGPGRHSASLGRSTGLGSLGSIVQRGSEPTVGASRSSDRQFQNPAVNSGSAGRATGRGETRTAAVRLVPGEPPRFE